VSERFLDPDERPRPAQSQIGLCSEQRDVPEVVGVRSHELGSEMNEGGMEFVNAGRASGNFCWIGLPESFPAIFCLARGYFLVL
jgi:hypothetical protein